MDLEGHVVVLGTRTPPTRPISGEYPSIELTHLPFWDIVVSIHDGRRLSTVDCGFNHTWIVAVDLWSYIPTWRTSHKQNEDVQSCLFQAKCHE